MGADPVPQPNEQQQPPPPSTEAPGRTRQRWYERPEGRSVYAAVPHTCWLVQQAHSAPEELVYRFLNNRPTVFHTPEGHRVVQASYNQIRAGCNFPWRTTAQRLTNHLKTKHSIRLAGMKHEGGKRRSGEGNNTPTYWVIPPWKDVLALRKADPAIGKDRLGRVWVMGRGKHFLTPEQIEEWKLDADYRRAPVPAYIPCGGEDEYADWAAAAQGKGQAPPAPAPRRAESPPGEPPPLPPGEPEIPPGADDVSPRGRRKKIPPPPAELWEFAQLGCKGPTEYPYVWKFLAEMRAQAAVEGYALPIDALRQLMLAQFRKLSPAKPDTFAYYYTVRGLLNAETLEKLGCPRLQPQEKSA